ncbi:MAG TPA: ATP-binding cassette domain-containing protein [Alphaproteobacteria bacterium]|nr:ATP-binding cassette domain-containing protein [Alphaproteobacteria bacterium]
MNEAPVLSFTDIRKSYGKTEALRGLSFSVGAGELVGLLGPNGAGKSTLFQIAAGLFAPDGGEVRVFGLDYRHHASDILGRLGVVFQSRSLDLDMSVRANLAFHGRLFGLSGQVLRERIAASAAQFEISDLLGRPVRTLSGGNQRRVEIVRALLNRPQLLLMDEPSTGLDAVSRRALVDHIGAIRAHTAILWATHLVDELETADRIVLIRAGRVVRAGRPAALMAETGTASLAAAYVALTGAAAELETETEPIAP